MKRFILAVFALIGGLAGPVLAQDTDNQHVSTEATILRKFASGANSGKIAPGLVQYDSSGVAIDPPTAGIAGTPSAKVASIQGVSGGTSVTTADQDGAAVTVTPLTATGTLFTADTLGYGYLAFQPTGTFSATLSITASDDGTTYAAALCGWASTAAASTTSTSGALAICSGHRYYRLAVTAYTSGTVGATAYLRSGTPLSPAVLLSAGTSTIGGTFGQAAGASGGVATVCRILSAAASTNSTNCKASIGRTYWITGYNAAASVRYLKLYNKASAPTCGTDTPTVTEALAPSSRFSINYMDIGLSTSLGIGICLTTGSADNDTGALTAGDIVGLNLYLQ